MLGATAWFAHETLLLGDDLLAWLMLAFGAALVVANVAALVRPPQAEPGSDTTERLERPPLKRVVPFIVLGVIVTIWATATLLQPHTH